MSIYRKYVDQYMKYGRKGYQVDPKDRKILLDLFDRGGQTEGYYREHNGRDMVVLREKPAFREENRPLYDYPVSYTHLIWFRLSGWPIITWILAVFLFSI